MLSVAQPLYHLPTNPSVKWLATQERNLNKELPYPDPAAETPEEYVSRTYLQFLWLPQSIMPLQFLIPALLRVASALESAPPTSTTSQQAAAHPLHSLLKHILLTSRAVSQKYHTRISQALAEENEPADPEDEFMWYAYQKDKVSEDERPPEGQDEFEAQERLKIAWLEKFERREMQIQILLYFLLLSLPGDGAGPGTKDGRSVITESLALPPSLSPSKSKKRRHKDRRKTRTMEPPPQPLEERLESYMDKLAMWQLMRSVDGSLGRGDGPKSVPGKGKQKQKDDRDWMQVFCEDVVEPLFKAKLPELCALFRSKIFPDAGNSDTDSLDLSPPVSPKPAVKRLKSAASTTSSRKLASGSTAKGKDTDLRARSRSLSLSLEQEQRERSRSLGIGANALRKRATMVEVTMTTKFSKARAKRAELERTASVPAPGPSLSRTQSQQSTAATGAQDSRQTEKSSKSTGQVLVAATPVKPRNDASRSQSRMTQNQSQTRLPALFTGPSTSSWTRPQSASQPTLARMDSLNIDTDEDEDGDMTATPTRVRQQSTLSSVLGENDGDGDGDEWTLNSSPDALLLGTSASQERHMPVDDDPPESSSPGDLGGFGGSDTPSRASSRQGYILVGDTPTKTR